ncbi:MAG TPA: hypothetical protein VFQ13_15245, partial [Anaerolineales bacterium]|nr:hypothetical protein [Anaerolineales bacterium]
DNPDVQPIKDVITRSYEIQHIPFCDPNSDLNLLEEVYIGIEDHRLSKNSKLLIGKYLGNEFISQAGYLTYKKAYFLWSRSGDPYPGSSTEGMSDSSTKIAPTKKPVRYCPDPYIQSEIRFESIAIRDNKAVVRYDPQGSINEAILIRVNDRWFIISTRVLIINV